MKIAMEIPEAHLVEISRFTDFDFALAHKVLQYGKNSVYCKFYRKQAENGRIVWLDNSAHELKEALSDVEILKAAKIINATHIVPHEVRDDHVLTFHHIRTMQETIHKKRLPYKVIGCWQGYKKDLAQLLETCDEVALPFDRPRTQFMDEELCKKIHYFGYRSLDEIRLFPPKSIDTSMPIRAAIHGIDLVTRERRPKTPLLDFTQTLTDRTLDQALINLQLMRKAAKNA